MNIHPQVPGLPELNRLTQLAIEVNQLRQANADLLEALERCVSVLRLTADGYKPEYRGKHNALDEAIEHAHAAIAKAESPT